MVDRKEACLAQAAVRVARAETDYANRDRWMNEAMDWWERAIQPVGWDERAYPFFRHPRCSRGSITKLNAWGTARVPARPGLESRFWIDLILVRERSKRAFRRCEEKPVFLFVRPRLLHDRNEQAADEPLGTPIERGLAAEL
jgi:hypothetical protein